MVFKSCRVSCNSALYELATPGHLEHDSRVAQWKRAGPITQRSVDRNHALLTLLLQQTSKHISFVIPLLNDVALCLINCFMLSPSLQ